MKELFEFRDRKATRASTVPSISLGDSNTLTIYRNFKAAYEKKTIKSNGIK